MPDDLKVYRFTGVTLGDQADLEEMTSSIRDLIPYGAFATSTKHQNKYLKSYESLQDARRQFLKLIGYDPSEEDIE